MLHRKSGAFSPAFADSLYRDLSKTRNLLTLQNMLEAAPESQEWFRPYVFAQIQRYKEKDDSEQAYYTYVVSTFDFSREKPSADFLNTLMSFLDSESLYTFSNTMICLYAIGQTAPLMYAMDKVNERTGFYHKKLLVDGLLSARTDGNEFNDSLLDKFHSYKPEMQDCLLDYFRMSNYDAAELCMGILRDGKAASQVGYSAMRYFAKHPTQESREYFLEVLSDDSAPWVPQLLSIQALRQYDDPAVYNAIMKKTTSPNWHVRINAVEYMHSRGLSREQIYDILCQRDRYANDSLLYQYRNDTEMTRYIADTIQQLEEQAKATAPGSDIDPLCGTAPTVIA